MLPVVGGYYVQKSGDGYFSRCKECVKQAVRDRRIEYPEKIAAYERVRWELPSRKKAIAGYLKEARSKDPERFRRYSRESIARYPEKRKARAAVQYAIKIGRLTRGVCEDCSAEKVQAHHADYSKPLEVTWLCARCHGRRHRDGSVGRKRNA